MLLLSFFLLSIFKICYILDIRPLSDIHMKMFYSNLGLCFILITLSFTEKKFNFNEIQLFSFIDHAFGIVSKKSLPNLKSLRFSAMLFSNSFIFYI